LPSPIGGKNVLPHQGRGNPAVLTDITVIDRVEFDKFVKCNTKAGCRKTLYFEPLADVVGGIVNATIIKLIVAYVSQTPNKWLEIIHQEKA
jgi:hypothetical protein